MFEPFAPPSNVALIETVSPEPSLRSAGVVVTLFFPQRIDWPPPQLYPCRSPGPLVATVQVSGLVPVSTSHRVNAGSRFTPCPARWICEPTAGAVDES